MNNVDAVLQGLARHAEQQHGKLNLRTEGGGKSGKTFCPCHNDLPNPSLSVWIATDGYARVKCYGNACKTTDIRKVCIDLGIWPNAQHGGSRADSPWIPQPYAPEEWKKFPASWPPCNIKDNRILNVLNVLNIT